MSFLRNPSVSSETGIWRGISSEFQMIQKPQIGRMCHLHGLHFHMTRSLGRCQKMTLGLLSTLLLVSSPLSFFSSQVDGWRVVVLPASPRPIFRSESTRDVDYVTASFITLITQSLFGPPPVTSTGPRLPSHTQTAHKIPPVCVLVTLKVTLPLCLARQGSPNV